MANGIGAGSGAAAYLQLRVPQDGLNQSLQYWGGIEARKRAAEGAAKEKEKARRAKQLERYDVDIKDFNITDAGYNDLNSANMALARNLLDDYSDLMYDAKDAFNANDTSKADRLYNKAQQIRSQFKNMQATMGTHKKNFENYQKDFTDGKVSGWSKGFGNFYKGGLVKGKFKFGKSPNGDIVRMIEFQDDKGNLKTQAVSDNDVQNGNFRYYLKQDTNKFTSDIAKDLGDTVEEASQGYFTTKSIQWGDKQNTAAKDLIAARVGTDEFMADMVDQFDLYEKFGIDKDNPPVQPDFTEEQRQEVAKRLLETVKGKYTETMQQKFNAQKYAADTRAATARARGKTKEDITVSNLKYDIDQAMGGDYTGLLKSYSDPQTNVAFNVVNVVESADGNSITLVKEDGTTLPPLPKNPRAISDFMIRNTPEYTKMRVGTERVLGTEANPYRTGVTGAAGIQQAIGEAFDEGGKIKSGWFTTQGKKIVKSLKDLGHDVQYESYWDRPDELTVNGKVIKLGKGATLQGVSQEIENAIAPRANTNKKSR